MQHPPDTTSTEKDIDAKICDLLASSNGQTDVLLFRDFKKKVDAYLETLSNSEKEIAVSILNDPEAGCPYYEETHDFNESPFDEDGRCYHGLTWDTCPCGCGEHPRPS